MSRSQMIIPKMLTTADVAAYLRVTKTTLEAYRRKGTGPPFVQARGSRTVRYSLKGLREWVEAGGKVPEWDE